MYRRAHILMISIAALMSLCAIAAAIHLHRRLVDPEGFLGPSWLRLPLLVSGAFLLDLLPRTLWFSRFRPREMPAIFRNRVRTHWNRARLTLVVSGLSCFYLTYVSYRNLKSFVPALRVDVQYDRELHQVDHALLLGHDPAVLLHNLLGTGFTAEILSSVYLWFLPLVPLALTAWLIWSRKLSFGYWFAASQCIAWALGTLSYYLLPTLGPGFSYAWLYGSVDHTAAGDLMTSLQTKRGSVLYGGFTDSVQSVAGFASLHVGITLLVALMIQYTLDIKIVRIAFWINFGLTAVATIYFGWHYLSDDIAGVALALLSFYLGGLASGQDFSRHPQPESVPQKVTTM